MFVFCFVVLSLSAFNSPATNHLHLLTDSHVASCATITAGLGWVRARHSCVAKMDFYLLLFLMASPHARGG